MSKQSHLTKISKWKLTSFYVLLMCTRWWENLKESLNLKILKHFNDRWLGYLRIWCYMCFSNSVEFELIELFSIPFNEWNWFSYFDSNFAMFELVLVESNSDTGRHESEIKNSILILLYPFSLYIKKSVCIKYRVLLINCINSWAMDKRE